MKKAILGVCFLSLFTSVLIYAEKPVEEVEIKKETEKTAPPVEEIIETASTETKTPSPYVYRGTWITHSSVEFTRVQFQIKDDVVNGVVSVRDNTQSTFSHASFTGMVHGDTIEGVFKDGSGENGVVTIKEQGNELILNVALTDTSKKESGLTEGEYTLVNETNSISIEKNGNTKVLEVK